MNNKRIIKATLIAALSISFLFNEPSFASSEEEKPLEANNQGLFEENEATVKRFFKDKNNYRLEPENPTMEPIILDQVTVLGKVIGLYRNIH